MSTPTQEHSSLQIGPSRTRAAKAHALLAKAPEGSPSPQVSSLPRHRKAQKKKAKKAEPPSRSSSEAQTSTDSSPDSSSSEGDTSDTSDDVEETKPPALQTDPPVENCQEGALRGSDCKTGACQFTSSRPSPYLAATGIHQGGSTCYQRTTNFGIPPQTSSCLETPCSFHSGYPGLSSASPSSPTVCSWLGDCRICPQPMTPPWILWPTCHLWKPPLLASGSSPRRTECLLRESLRCGSF